MHFTCLACTKFSETCLARTKFSEKNENTKITKFNI